MQAVAVFKGDCVIARYLGSGCGLKLGRQAAWRPGTIMVSSGWLAALCKQSLFSDCGVFGSGCGMPPNGPLQAQTLFECADRVLCAGRHTQQISC